MGTDDAYQKFKSDTATLLEYREAYHELKRRDPQAVTGLPDPEGDPKTFDAAQALASIRQQGGGALRTDPRRDLRT